jgi:methylmalonyl-CoA mutase cobalamin-binding subunit
MPAAGSPPEAKWSSRHGAPAAPDELRAAGAAAIFSPGTVIPDAAYELLTELAARAGTAP